MSKDSEGKAICQPILAQVVSLYAEKNELQYAVTSVRMLCVRVKVEQDRCYRALHVDAARCMFTCANSKHWQVPGGLIGLGTKIDPTLTRTDR